MSTMYYVLTKTPTKRDFWEGGEMKLSLGSSVPILDGVECSMFISVRFLFSFFLQYEGAKLVYFVY